MFALQENISLPLVFIDGITRCGKSAFSGIIPSLTRMEHIQFSTEIELIISGLSLNGLKKEYAKSFLRIYFNELSYNLHLSRNINFRPDDQTGIDNYKDPDIYKKRLTAPEGSDVVDICKSSNNYIPFQTHDFLVNLKLVEEMEINFKMLSLWRNPVENIYSWWTRGWGERYNGDPTGFSLLIEGEKELYPWYAADFEKELTGLNPMEKCIRIATDLFNRAIKSYEETRLKNNIHLFSFEDFCTTPDEELSKICQFLDVEPSTHTKKYLELARFPRPINKNSIENKIEAFKEGVSAQYFDLLMDFQLKYEENKYGLF